MLFNSLTFIVFFIIVYTLYIGFHKRLKIQNFLLLVASYIFYGYWDWRFLILIWISTLTDYIIGRALGKTDIAPSNRSKRKILLAISIIVNLSLLGFFKYFNFFVDSFANLLQLFGLEADPIALSIVLPVGISFYTFQTMSYTIDIYRNRMRPTNNLLNFAVFVAFFPQLVAGPIERAKNLLPQIEKRRIFIVDQITVGIYLILWGYFKKVVIADNVSSIANQVFNNYPEYAGLDIILGVVAFAIQIYGDFSGYSDIARGISRLMGFELMVNFRLPYFAIDPSDFWNRWHISLSTWLRDYLYIPLGGNRKGTLNTYRNLFLTMLLGGLWHGAAWNFVIWGGYHGVLLILYRLFDRKPAHEDPWRGDFSYVVVIAKMAVMFVLTMIGWLIFRSTSVEQIRYMLTSVSLVPSSDSMTFITELLFFGLPLFIIQLYQYIKRDLLIVPKFRTLLRLTLYGLSLVWIILFGAREATEFIYFQF
jgi:D-alanyl-lipoteichoic acid acyltransferase DltB (MBOAT superfamily)